MSPEPVVIDGFPTGIARTELKEIMTRPSGVTDPIMY